MLRKDNYMTFDSSLNGRQFEIITMVLQLYNAEFGTLSCNNQLFNKGEVLQIWGNTAQHIEICQGEAREHITK